MAGTPAFLVHVGLYPVEAVETMARIAQRMEDALRQEELWAPRRQAGLGKVTDAISQATCMIAADINAAAILTLTKTGSTARMVSRYRPDCPVIAATPDEKVVRQLCVVWGVEPLMVGETTGTDAMMTEAVECALQAGRIDCGDLVVITAGVPVGVAGTTNLLKVHVAGKVLTQGMGIGKKTAVGKVHLCRQAADAEKAQSGDIIVAYATERAFIPAIEKCAGIVAEQGGLTSHAAIVGLHYNIPVIVGVEEAMQRLTDGSVVSLDCERGIIYAGVAKVL
ncbi:MAG: pyruvate kinase alpha/beta domain-containing protein [Heliobacteriaceae bacterium]|nr:pyruvate kinase alpha/beta domain-containing protein [Heliobacteriaceae bacterium]